VHSGWVDSYSVKEGIVIERTDFGSKSTQFVRGSKPGPLAYILLGELFYDVSSELLSKTPEQPQ
jgi:hypothetical protein